jgi:iron-sulfur cluster repair protein YtfE (RIC family)
VEKKVANAHRKLDALLSETLSVLCEDAPGGREAFEDLRDAIEAHMSLEEDLYFPTICAVRPEHEEQIQSFIHGHKRFSELLGELAVLTEGGQIGEASRKLGEFGEAFSGHEDREERLLNLIDLEFTDSQN